MGLALHSTRFPIQAHRSGVRFDETLTLGRQQVLLSPERIESLLREGGCSPASDQEAAFRRELTESRWRFDAIARAFGARRAVACDASAYEGAGLVRDLNQPIPGDWGQRFDVVIDGGTLEHVFNFPVAMANCLRFVKTGGHLILFTPANNYFGHGFYQFSPELFFRVLSPENGFQVERMIALEDSYGRSSPFGVTCDFPVAGPWHEVRDPAVIRQRVQLINGNPTALYILARKTAHVTPFRSTPQQSDYVEQ